MTTQTPEEWREANGFSEGDEARSDAAKSLLGVANPDDETATHFLDKQPARVEALREAANLITGDRQQDYGPPEVNFQRIADVWTVLLGRKFTPSEVALAMIGLKMARAAEGYKRDTYIDLAGYAALLIELAEKGL